jgi:hypothetical protein
MDHVRVEGRWTRALQDGVTPAWRQIGDGCHLNRDTLSAVREAESVVAVADKPAALPVLAIRARAPW